jgi:hypothetical protein
VRDCKQADGLIDVTNRRNFHESYAKRNGFNPYVPENWLKHFNAKISSSKVSTPRFYCFIFVRKRLFDSFFIIILIPQFKGAVKKYHFRLKRRYLKALTLLFPEIGVVPSSGYNCVCPLHHLYWLFHFSFYSVFVFVFVFVFVSF